MRVAAALMCIMLTRDSSWPPVPTTRSLLCRLCLRRPTDDFGCVDLTTPTSMIRFSRRKNLHTCFIREGAWRKDEAIRYAVRIAFSATDGKRMHHHLYNISRLIMYCVIRHCCAPTLIMGFTPEKDLCVAMHGMMECSTRVIQIVYATCSIFTARRHHILRSSLSDMSTRWSSCSP